MSFVAVKFAALVLALACCCGTSHAALEVQQFSTTEPFLLGYQFTTQLWAARDLTVSNNVVLVDCGFQSTIAATLQWASSNGLTVVACLLTHPHPDHFEGWKYLIANGSSVAFYVHTAAEPTYMNAFALQVLGDTFNYSTVAVNVINGNSVTVGGLTFTVDRVTTDAESPTSAMYYHSASNSLFPGDNLFYRAHWPLSTFAKIITWRNWIDSLSDRYSANTRVFPGHGPSGTLQEVIADSDDYLDFFAEQICKTQGNITAVAAAFSANPRFGSYLNHDLAYTLWGFNPTEWPAYYANLTAAGECSPAAALAASAMLVAAALIAAL
jgi:glyoxylase-like metal-dependent hydrolase (beta-lactamase superfamily II)